MKKVFTLLTMLISITCFGQKVNYNKKGIVKNVDFRTLEDKELIPKNAKEFNEKFLNVDSNYEFKIKPHYRNRNNLKNERFEQYYKGVRVE